MGHTQTLINFIIKLQNAAKCKKFSFIETNPSIKIIQILNLLINVGLIRSYFIEKKKLIIILKYKTNGDSIFKQIQIISKPGTIMHLPNKLIYQQINNFPGICIFSTSLGFLTHEDVKKKNLGGILLYKIYF